MCGFSGVLERGVVRLYHHNTFTAQHSPLKRSIFKAWGGARIMVETYDFDDPRTLHRIGRRRSPLKRINAILSGIALGLGIYASPLFIAPVPAPFTHQGVEIRAMVENNRPWIRRPQVNAVRDAIDDVISEMDKYPDGFLSDTCALETVYVTPPESDSPFIGRYYRGLNAMQIMVSPSLPRPASAQRTARIFVHEADHACNVTNRTLEDVVRWDALVSVPYGVDEAMINHYAFEPNAIPPEGFANWYGMTTATTDDASVRHLEDEATIKELITYGWQMIDEREDPVLDAKIDLLIDRYTDWSGGVMDEDYFRSWSVPGFSYDDRDAFR